MQLSLQTDYSFRILIYLASFQPKVCRIEEIAEAYKISRSHLVKIVQELRRLGYIETVRGRAGGLILGRTPDHIQVGQLLQQMEPHLKLLECFDRQQNQCVLSPSCELKHWLGKALANFLQTFDGLTLADLLQERQAMSRLLQPQQ